MNLIPDPLHPAIVHFPIVLILLGSAVAVGAAVWRKHHLPLIAGVLLALGAIGAWVGVETGESDGGLVESGAPQAESLLDEHEDWAKRTLAASATAATLAILSLALVRFPRAARATAVLTALAAIGASYAVYETGHRGGALVFKHGAGVGSAVAQIEPAGRMSDDDSD